MIHAPTALRHVNVLMTKFSAYFNVSSLTSAMLQCCPVLCRTDSRQKHNQISTFCIFLPRPPECVWSVACSSRQPLSWKTLNVRIGVQQVWQENPQSLGTSWDILRHKKFLSVERPFATLARLRQDPSVHHPSVAANSRSDEFFVGSDDLLFWTSLTPCLDGLCAFCFCFRLNA